MAVLGFRTDYFWNGTATADQIAGLTSLGFPTTTTNTGSVTTKATVGNLPVTETFPVGKDFGSVDFEWAFDPQDDVHAEIWKAGQDATEGTLYIAFNREAGDANPRIIPYPCIPNVPTLAGAFDAAVTESVSFVGTNGTRPLARIMPDQSYTGSASSTQTLELATFFAGSSALTYAATSGTTSVATVAVSDSTLTTTLLTDGTTEIEITATDVDAQTVSTSFVATIDVT